MKNEILDEIRRTREELEAESNNDLKALFVRMQKKTAISDRKHYAGVARKKKTRTG